MSNASAVHLHLPPDQYAAAIHGLHALLRAVDACSWNLYIGPALQRAIWRYELYWLPLQSATQPNVTSSTCEPPVRVRNIRRALLDQPVVHESLVAPLDVAWVWYLHRLGARIYVKQTQQLVGIAPQPDRFAAFRFDDGTTSCQSARSYTERVWRLAFPDDREHYFPPYLLPKHRVQPVHAPPPPVADDALHPIPHRMTFDRLISRCARMHRAVLRQFEINSKGCVVPYLTMVDMYDKFMHLSALHQFDALVLEPNAYQDMVWRAHIACTKEYVDDPITGVGGRPHVQVLRATQQISNEEEALMARRRLTDRLWFDAFGCDVGPMYSKQELVRDGGDAVWSGACMQRLIRRWMQVDRGRDCSECAVFGSANLNDASQLMNEQMQGRWFKLVFTKLTKRINKYEYKRHLVRIIATVALIIVGGVCWAVGVSMMSDTDAAAAFGVVAFYFGSVLLVVAITTCAHSQQTQADMQNDGRLFSNDGRDEWNNEM